MEKPPIRPEIGQKQENASAVEQQDKFLENIVFLEVKKKDGTSEYRSSSPDRKIVILDKFSRVPEIGKAYRVLVIEDSEPTDPMRGKMTVELALDKEQEQEMIESVTQAQELFIQNDISGTLSILEKVRNKFFIQLPDED